MAKAATASDNVARMPNPAANLDNPARRRRLNDEDRAKILQLKSEGRTAKDIAEMLQTTSATVSKVLIAGGMGRGGKAVVAAAELSHTQIRLINYAVAILLGEQPDETESADLAQIVRYKIEAARTEAVKIAMMNL